MKTVVIFEGGNSGSLLITDNGVRPIPPFEADIRLMLKSASAMVNSLSASSNPTIRGKKAKLALSLSNLAITEVENVVGALEGEQCLIYQDEDGGFTCGSTGKPPLPITWPPTVLPSLPSLISSGVIEKDLIELLQGAKAAKVPYTKVFEKPVDMAKKFGVSISDKTAKDLKILAPSNLSKIKEPTDREIIKFFHKVIDDGRFDDDWLKRPAEVAKELKVRLSEPALERIITGGAAAEFGLRGGINAFADVGVCVAVVTAGDVIIIAVVAIASGSIEDIIRDRSGIEKI